MNWNKENPCFGCTVRMPNGDEKRAPCCWDVGLVLTAIEYNSHFVGKPNVNLTSLYESRVDDDASLVQIRTDGPCPNLDILSGKCLIKNKPGNCSIALPKTFSICAQNPEGRWNELYVFDQNA